uniref:type-2 ice-structuring protein-like n=1 Tax=Scatophagus argus TaxID=75038 RepID=UPI001ED7EFB9|nr:type-2 ice-structuring protein-like [Scatophagus argus]
MLSVSLLVCALLALSNAQSDDNISANETIIAPIGVEPIVKLAGTNCPLNWVLYQGRCFLFVPTQMHWAKAQENCLKQKGTLASIHNLDEYQFIQQLTTAEHLQTWVGGSDCQEEGLWFWIDSTHYDYNLWCPGQPDNSLDQCCLQINTGGGKCWDDVPCKSLNPSICVMPAN